MKNGKSMRRLSTCKVVNLQFSFFSTPIWLERIFICSITPMIIKILIFCETYKLQSLFYFKITLNHACEFYLRNFSKEPTLKRGIFWIQHDQCGHSEWNIAIGSAGEYLSRNSHEIAENFSDRPEKAEKGKYRSLKCWNLEYYHLFEVHSHTSAICMYTMFEQVPVSGLAITCMKTVLEHGCFNVIPFMLLLQRNTFYLLP